MTDLSHCSKMLPRELADRFVSRRLRLARNDRSITDTSRTIERDGGFADLFIDAEPSTSDDVSITRDGLRLDSEEKIRAFFASVGLLER